MANHVRPISVSPADRAALERLQRAPSTAAGLSRRARAIVLMVQGLSGVEIAARIGRRTKTVEVFEGSIPESIAPLVRQLRQLMSPEE